ncbi:MULTISPECIES: hypothetical protein [Cytobacillus]|uniref:hypothetical protein n=1 Tax=Cytobacillus TaxID=2675230 RepID=UPI001CD4FB57|nr:MULTISPECIES: hypothetical protein [Cytobacillus]MCA1027558.1 hypothetical protein [Cytobacillus kochii]MCM3321928.1 hypothetical protein [Cytobacillus kochii]MCM3343239.1 hypothetical protein [Cytobacillus kochii]MDM5207067.1 hypothetical protein [Cytobacillus kochii]MEA1851743.1 hypothetical protein [Cytobacillus sp. OWB-43]
MLIAAIIQWHRFWFVGINYFLEGDIPEWLFHRLFSKSMHHQEKLIFFLKKQKVTSRTRRASLHG